MKWHFYGIAQIEWRQKNINIVNTYSYHVSLVSSLYLKDQHEHRFLTRAARDYFNQSELRIFSYWPIRDKYFVYSRFIYPTLQTVNIQGRIFRSLLDWVYKLFIDLIHSAQSNMRLKLWTSWNVKMRIRSSYPENLRINFRFHLKETL